MIIIRFPDDAMERKGLGYLAGRFSFKTWATGETAVPEVALAYMARKEFASAWRDLRLMPTSSQHRRYEILLPLQHNDGQPVPEALVAETLLELRQRFGALSAESQTIRGEWVYQGQLYRDNSIAHLPRRARPSRTPPILCRVQGAVENALWTTCHLDHFASHRCSLTAYAPASQHGESGYNDYSSLRASVRALPQLRGELSA